MNITGRKPGGGATATLSGSDGAGVAERALVRWGGRLLLLTVLTPLMIVPGFLYPYVVPRAVYFRTLVLLASVAVVALMVRRQPDFRGGDRVVMALAAFAGIALLTAFTGVSVTRSLYGDLERLWGVLGWLHLALYYFLLRTLLDERGWRRYLDGAVAVSAVVTLVGLLQTYSYLIPGAEFGNVSAAATFRPHSTLGNAGYLSAYLVLAVAATVVRARQIGRGAVGLALWLVVGAQTWLFLIVWGEATLVGVGVALIGVAGWLFFRARGRGRLWGAIPALVIAICVGALAWPGAWIWGRIPILGRVAASARLDEDRLELWHAALEAAATRPLFGWGLENTTVALNSGIDPAYFGRMSTIATAWDRVHNLYLEVLVGTGIGGLVIFLGVWVAVFLSLFRAVRIGTITSGSALALAGGLIAYFTYLFFWFEDWANTPLAIGLAAYIGSRSQDAPLLTFGPARQASRTKSGILIGFTVAMAIVLLQQWSVRPLAGARLAAQAVRATPGPAKFERFGRAIIRAGVLSPPVTLEMEFALQAALRGNELERTTVERAARVALASTSDEIARDPRNDLLHAQRARILRTALLVDPDRRIYQAAIVDADRAIALSPSNIDHYHLLAELQILGGDGSGALGTLDRARGLFGGLSMTEQLATRAELEEGRTLAAYRSAFAALERPGTVSAQFYLTVRDRLVAEGRFEEAARLGEAVLIRRYPEARLVGGRRGAYTLRGIDREIAARLPLDYLRAGDTAGARGAADLLRAGIVDVGPPTDRFLTDLEAGNVDAWVELDAIPIPRE